MRILVDADACPVKDEIYKVAKRYALPVTLVANAGMSAPRASWLELIIVKQGANVADDLIVEKTTAEDIVVTADIPLASRCLERGALVIDQRGGEFTRENIGTILAGREIGEHLRAAGIDTKGPRPLEKQARSAFLQTLDRVIQQRRRKK